MAEGNLIATINEGDGLFVEKLNIENNNLYAYYRKDDGNVAKVDLGQVVPNITVGTTTTGNAGTSASVTNTGTPQNPEFNFTIPKGSNGTNGTNGTNGKDGISPTFSIDDNGHLLADYYNPYTPPNG